MHSYRSGGIWLTIDVVVLLAEAFSLSVGVLEHSMFQFIWKATVSRVCNVQVITARGVDTRVGRADTDTATRILQQWVYIWHTSLLLASAGSMLVGSFRGLAGWSGVINITSEKDERLWILSSSGIG